MAHDKETVARLVLTYMGKDYHGKPEITTAVEARWYMGRGASASRVYCTVWAHSNLGDNGAASSSGHGWAGGCGYHKESAALSEALDSAGFKLDKDFSGYGDGAMRDAMLAVAQHLGHPLDGYRFI